MTPPNSQEEVLNGRLETRRSRQDRATEVILNPKLWEHKAALVVSILAIITVLGGGFASYLYQGWLAQQNKSDIVEVKSAQVEQGKRIDTVVHDVGDMKGSLGRIEGALGTAPVRHKG